MAFAVFLGSALGGFGMLVVGASPSGTQLGRGAETGGPARARPRAGSALWEGVGLEREV